MLSKGPAQPGRSIAVSSGGGVAVHSTYERAYLVTVERRVIDSRMSVYSAPQQLEAQVQPDDQWVQIDRVQFNATHYSGYHARTVTLTATAHR